MEEILPMERAADGFYIPGLYEELEISGGRSDIVIEIAAAQAEFALILCAIFLAEREGLIISAIELYIHLGGVGRFLGEEPFTHIGYTLPGPCAGSGSLICRLSREIDR